MAKYNFITKNNKGLTEFPFVAQSQRRFKQRISVTNNSLSKLPNYFSEFESLTNINLSGNDFSVIPEQLFNLDNLQIVKLDNNNIKRLDNISKLLSVNTLSLSGNKIQELPNKIGLLTDLLNLDISKNSFSEFPTEVLPIEDLRTLNISGNNLSSIPNEIGRLKNLVKLDLSNNNIKRIPEEFRELKSLKEINLSNNNFRLAEDYDPHKPFEAIDFILSKQEFAKLKTTKAFVFKNFSKNIILDKYNSVLEDFTKNRGIDIHSINGLKDINTDVTVVFFIVGFDIHDDKKLIFKLIEKCQTLEIPYFILMEEDIIGGKAYVHLKKGELFENQQRLLKETYRVINYTDYDILTNFIFNAINERTPNIKLTNIELENIGPFEQVDIPISQKICCLLGENGTGKSTILKSIALAMIGHKYEGIELLEVLNLLRIRGFDKKGVKFYEKGSIKLKYTIDADEYYNEIQIIPNDDGNPISIVQKGDYEISTTGYNLKTLVLGFPQMRGNIKERKGSFQKNSQPHVSDVIPMINNYVDNRLNSFSHWLTQLYFASLKQKEHLKSELSHETKEMSIIEVVFRIISEISDKAIQFETVEPGDPPVVWVSTFDAPKGVPLTLLSQGFKVIMSWIGHFLQRLIESYPIQGPEESIKNNNIIIIDEIDTFIHPKWQSKLIKVIRGMFPNTQFIISTHSPLAVSSCNENEVHVLEIVDNQISNRRISNPKGWLVEDILSELMGVPSSRDSQVDRDIIRIEELFLKKYKNEISRKEMKELESLTKQISNLPPEDPIVTLLKLRSFKKSLK